MRYNIDVLHFLSVFVMFQGRIQNPVKQMKLYENSVTAEIR